MSATFWIKALELIASLSLLVFIHELGHYMWARIFGVKVLKFYLFFNPWVTLASWLPRDKKVRFFYRNPKEETDEQKSGGDSAPAESPGEGREETASSPSSSAVGEPDSEADGKSTWRDTEYGIGWVPLGGYCAIAGMIDETQSSKDMSDKVQAWEFRSKPSWQRLLIMVGGVLNNFLLAILIYAGMVYYWGEEYLPYKNAKLGMEFCESAQKVGFRNGDIPIEADGKQLVKLTSDEMQTIFTSRRVKVLRGTDTVTVELPKNFIFTVNKEAENGKPVMGYRMPVVVESTMPAEGAEKAGMKKGDIVVAVDSVEALDYTTFTARLARHKGKSVPISYVRGADTLTVDVAVNSSGKVGVQLRPINKVYETEVLTYSLLGSIPRGIDMGVTQLVNYVKQFKYVFTKEGAQSLGGFGAIGSIFPDTWDWYAFWNITAFLSVILAFMNILPIPALDGGHVLFLLYEMIFRRKPGDKFLERAQMVGMAFLFALLIYANGNDIYRWVIKPLFNL